MKDQINTIREFFLLPVPHSPQDTLEYGRAKVRAEIAVSKIEAMAGEQEPVGAVLVNRESREGVMFYSPDMIPDPTAIKDRFELVTVFASPVAQQYAAGDMASAAAQGFRDGVASVTAGQEPVAWAVYWGLPPTRQNSVHFDKESAQAVANQIKSATEVRPLYAAPVAQQPQAEAVSVECHEVIAGVTGNTVRPRELTEREHNVLMRALVRSGKKVEAPQQAEAMPPDVVRDAERLDYLQHNGSTVELLPGVGGFLPMRFRVGGLHVAVSESIRGAIDAAIAAQGEKP